MPPAAHRQAEADGRTQHTFALAAPDPELLGAPRASAQRLAVLARLTLVPTPDRVVRDGRSWISRAEIERLTEVSPAHQRALHTKRATNGHPPGERIGRATFFAEEPTLAWYRDHQAQRRASLTAPDRGGDADELLDVAGASELLGFQSTSTIYAYLARGGQHFPEPDQVEQLTSRHVRRRWRRQTLWDFADGRTGRGPGRAAAPADHRDGHDAAPADTGYTAAAPGPRQPPEQGGEHRDDHPRR